LLSFHARGFVLVGKKNNNNITTWNAAYLLYWQTHSPSGSRDNNPSVKASAR